MYYYRHILPLLYLLYCILMIGYKYVRVFNAVNTFKFFLFFSLWVLTPPFFNLLIPDNTVDNFSISDVGCMQSFIISPILMRLSVDDAFFHDHCLSFVKKFQEILYFYNCLKRNITVFPKLPPSICGSRNNLNFVRSRIRYRIDDLFVYSTYQELWDVLDDVYYGDCWHSSWTFS